MKKKITAVLAVLMLLTAFASCGGVKKEELLGEWVHTYIEDSGGERKKSPTNDQFLGEYMIIRESTIVLVNIYSTGEDRTIRDWELSSSGKITLINENGEKTNIYNYKDGELIYEYSNGTKGIFIKK